MANGGWYGTKEEWERIEGPLLDTDPIIDAFAKEFGVPVSRNYKDWPERSLIWQDDGVRCLMQIYLAEEKSLSFNFGIVASEDRGNERYLKQEVLIRGKRVPEFKDSLAAQLREGREKLMEWSKNKNQLQFATTLRG